MILLKKLSLFLSLIALTLTLGLTSCTKEDPIGVGEESFNFVSAGTYVEDIQISTPTLDSEIKLLNEVTPQAIDNGTLFGGKAPMLPFRELIKILKLSEEQMIAFKELIKAHIDCERLARMEYYKKISEILRAANEERKAIREQVANGTLEKKDAYKLLRELEIRTQKAIQESGAAKELRIALKACTDELMAKMKEVLTPEQYAKFEKWMKRKMGNTGSGTGPSTGTGTRP